METETVRRAGASPALARQAATQQPAATPAGTVQVSVVYAQRDRSWCVALTVPVGTDVGTVVKSSGFAQAFPAYPSQEPAVGIFGRRCRLDERVSEGDRIEIYRPLDYDPMESRRRRAEHRKVAAQQASFRPRRVRDAGNS